MAEPADSSRTTAVFGVRASTPSLEFRTETIPWKEDGALPPGLDVDLVSEIVRNSSSEASMIAALGVKKRSFETSRQALHRALRTPRNLRKSVRARAGAYTFPALVAQYVYNQDEALYGALFNNRLPLFEGETSTAPPFDVDRARRAVIDEMKSWETLEDDLDDRARLVALATWAFAVTTPVLARSAIEPMAEAHPAVARWFGLEIADGPDEIAADANDAAAAEADPPSDHEASPLPTTSLEPASVAARATEDPFVRGILGLLREIGKRQEDLVHAANEARYVELSGMAAALERAVTGLRERLAHKAQEVGIAQGELPEPSPPALTSAEGFAAYVTNLADALAEAALRGKHRVDEARATYLGELADLSLPPPPGLEDASSLDQLEAILRDDSKRMTEARFRRSLRGKDGPDGQARAAVAAARRVQIYLEEAHRPETDPARAIAWLESEERTSHADPAVSARDLAGIVQGWVRRSKGLSKGTWALLEHLDRTALLERLRDPELAAALARADATSVRAAELVRVVGPDAHTLPPTLQRLVRVIQANEADPATRVRVFAELVAEDPTDGHVAIELLRALGASGRLAELWLTVDALVRTRHNDAALDDLRPFLLTFLAERASVDGSHHAVLSEFVDNDEWVGEDLDALTVLLFLAVRTDKGRAVLFRHPRRVAELEAERPALCGSWLRPRLERTPSRLDDPRLLASFRRGHEAIAAWDHAIQQRTCYNDWRYAAAYQRYIRTRLEAMFALLTGGEATETNITPEQMLREIANEADLPEPEHTGLANMLAYIGEQIARIRRVVEAMSDCAASLDELRRASVPPDRARLETEAASPRNQSDAIVYVYRAALAAAS